MLNTEADLAAECGVPFVNFNSSESYHQCGLDFAADFESHNHLNYRGSVKFTRVLGELITNGMDLPDHRGDPAYQSWERNSESIRLGARDWELHEDADPAELAGRAFREEQLEVFLCKINADGVTDTIPDGSLIHIRNGEAERVNADGNEPADYFCRLNSVPLAIRLNGADGSCSIRFDNKEYVDDARGSYLFLYDTYNRELVRVCQIAEGEAGVPVLTDKIREDE